MAGGDRETGDPRLNVGTAARSARAAVPRRPRFRASRRCALLWTAAGGVWVSGACTHDLEMVQDPPRGVAVTTTGPWASMIYVARTDSGLVAIDLGWTGADDALRDATARLGGTPADVRWAFLTHAHRDHIAAWPLVRQARFVLGAAEVPFFTGDSAYRGWITSLSDDLNEYPVPRPGELDLLPLGADSTIVLGADTVRAFILPGHTPGSMAYLFRGILFGGDAINWRPGQGFQGARPEFSDSVEQSRESMRMLWKRLPDGMIRIACSAHGKCAVADSALRAATVR
jgi:glyoxylase-like metal-dependent hydrolase (beta-lactamase superfamily II)